MNKLWKRVSIISSIIYFLSLIPLFFLGRYMYPAADDYSFGSRCKEVWDTTHSFIHTLLQAGRAAAYYYENWAGCFTSSFFMVLQPSVFGSDLYWFTPLVMIMLLSISSWYFLRTLLQKWMNWKKEFVYSFTFVYLFVVVQSVPSPLEAYFWYNGAVHYTFMHSLSLFYCGLILNLVKEERKQRKNLYLFSASVLALLIGGGNYLTGLNVAIVSVMGIAALVYGKKGRKNIRVFLPILLFFLSFVLNVAAPGNSVRAEISSGMDPLKAIVLSFYYVYEYCIGEWTGWMVLLGAFVVGMITYSAIQGSRFRFPYPLLVAVVNFCLTAAVITPCLYGTGNIEAGRIQSLIFTLYVLFLYLTVGYAVGWMKVRIEEQGQERTESIRTMVNTGWTLAGCLLFWCMGYGIVALAEPQSFTSSEAVRELISGEAMDYALQMEQRQEHYTSGEKKVVVSGLTVHPPLLFFSDIGSDPESWENQVVADFFQLESVRIGQAE